MSERAEAIEVDVLIVGAGLSGICAGYYMQTECPQLTYTILEARDCIGGTWDLFRYPGIRSDSDMHTLGYAFRPWEEARAIADGPAILKYVRETAAMYGIDRKITFGMRMMHASWSSEDNAWTVRCRSGAFGEGDQEVVYRCNFLWGCTGYYRYDRGYTPDFPGRERFQGEVIHPQSWSEDTVHAGKRVVVIGSGATAITLVPELAKTAAHVTMLQRSPTYIFSAPNEDPIANALRAALPHDPAHRAIRWKNIFQSLLLYHFSKRFPERARAWFVDQVREAVGDVLDVDTHFQPHYGPWDQRLCLAPDGDIFDALRSGKASVVTDHIESFTEDGIALRSGESLEADMIVTATGLELQVAGGATIEVDGEAMVASERTMYKGAMLSGVPNMALTLGYTNASWTLKCELVCIYVCRLLNHMHAHGYSTCNPELKVQNDEAQPLLDLNSGYINRAKDQIPKQGERAPWKLYQNTLLDRIMLKHNAIDDGDMRFA